MKSPIFYKNIFLKYDLFHLVNRCNPLKQNKVVNNRHELGITEQVQRKNRRASVHLLFLLQTTYFLQIFGHLKLTAF